MITERIAVDMQTLDQAGKAANRAVVAVQDAQMYRTGDDLRLMDDALAQAKADTEACHLLLREMGALVPEAPPRSPVPLQLLDTPAMRRLANALEAARNAAEAVDRERGWTANGQGCGLTDAVNDLLYRVLPDVQAPAGRE